MPVPTVHLQWTDFCLYTITRLTGCVRLLMYFEIRDYLFQSVELLKLYMCSDRVSTRTSTNQVLSPGNGLKRVERLATLSSSQ